MAVPIVDVGLLDWRIIIAPDEIGIRIGAPIAKVEFPSIAIEAFLRLGPA